MIRKEKKLLITFHTTTDAMAMESLCRRVHADGRLVPVPGSISAGCGLAWCADPASRASLVSLMAAHRIEYQQVHECLI